MCPHFQKRIQIRSWSLKFLLEVFTAIKLGRCSIVTDVNPSWLLLLSDLTVRLNCHFVSHRGTSSNGCINPTNLISNWQGSCCWEPSALMFFMTIEEICQFKSCYFCKFTMTCTSVENSTFISVHILIFFLCLPLAMYLCRKMTSPRYAAECEQEEKQSIRGRRYSRTFHIMKSPKCHKK